MQERHKCKNISLHVRLSISYSIILKHESFSQILDRFPRTLLLPLSKQFNLFSRAAMAIKHIRQWVFFCCNRHLSVFCWESFDLVGKKYNFSGDFLPNLVSIRGLTGRLIRPIQSEIFRMYSAGAR